MPWGTKAIGIDALAMAPDGRTVAGAGTCSGVYRWDLASGRLLTHLGSRFAGVRTCALSPDRHTLISTGGAFGLVWDGQTGRFVRTLPEHGGPITALAYTGDSHYVYTASRDGRARSIDLSANTITRTFLGHTAGLTALALTPTGRLLLTAADDATARVWDTETGKELRRLNGHIGAVTAVACSPDGRLALTGGADHTVRLWEVASGRELRQFRGHTDHITSVAYASDNRTILTGSADGTARLWDAWTGKLLQPLAGHRGGVRSVAFSPDGRVALTGGDDRTARTWSVATGQALQRLIGHDGLVAHATFGWDGRLVLTASPDGTVRLWMTATGQELCRAAVLNIYDQVWQQPPTAYLVVDPSHRFDATGQGAMDGVYWLVGDKLLQMSQLKDRYYEPGLLSKLLGLNPEPLRTVPITTTASMAPSVDVTPPAEGVSQLTIALHNSGGGIGPVRLRVNGKDVVADARPTELSPTALEATITVDLATVPGLIPGRTNHIEVVACNTQGDLVSRGIPVTWTQKGTPPTEPPELYAIVVGVSDYAGKAIDLQFAGKDAVRMATAMRIGGERLFGKPRVHLALLTTEKVPDAQPPTKPNLLSIFAQVKAQARPQDLLVVYLAGHGVTLPQGKDTYCFLTQEAQTLQVTDLAREGEAVVTSQEFADLMQAIPAQKQAMMLDTCAAGQAVGGMQMRGGIPGDQTRALSRMAERAGFFVLMGCAADAVSYETNKYGQGLLSYSLMQGMKGAALRDGSLADVSTLFQFAVDTVPKLARNLGGIQRPEIFAPEGNSFDVGQFVAEDRLRIPLPLPKPFIAAPVLQDSRQIEDTLKLGERLSARLRHDLLNYGDGQGSYILVPVSHMPDAIKVSALYDVVGTQVRVRMKITPPGATHGSTTLVTGTTRNIPALVEALAGRILHSVTATSAPTPPARGHQPRGTRP